MPFFVILLLVLGVGGAISVACDSSDAKPSDDIPFGKPPKLGPRRTANPWHPNGGFFTHHNEGYREGHHRRRSDGSYIY
jgi:hypothetical protein